jgi:hypothetical protein
MVEGEDRMAEGHARAGIAHYLFHFLPHGRLITVNRTIGARSLVFLKRALVEAQFGIIEEFPAFGAESVLCSMIAVMGTAVNL